MRLRRSSVVARFVLGLLVPVLGGCAHTGGRYFQPSAEQIGPDTNSYGEVVLPLHGLIAVQGDDLAYGLARGRSRREINGADRGQAGLTISEVLRKAIKGVTVENRGFPDDTVAQSLVRWETSKPPNLVIFCLGFGDASAHTPLDTFTSGLELAIRTARGQGAAVFVVIPPQLADTFEDHQVQDYRDRARAAAAKEGVEVFDAAASMRRISRAPVKTAAQAPAVYQAVAADMVPYIKVVRGNAS